jgi:hypothetical protein
MTKEMLPIRRGVSIFFDGSTHGALGSLREQLAGRKMSAE